ncbi:glycosyltransferase family 2 protein [Metabacillus arenae]|uniref:Glycosyltransferase family 2 protein n=1 Tax=Metabacillus arenae TaxID=2771434 RepID=A0A926RYN1_9BACI|nr:glycosyltransferase [Metabacillus arenae]MBD1381935.1 glycosyltransferase family 2 protein [Metabacillus arenae]
MPKVTVILTSYNKPKTIGDSIKSVISQTFKDWELFIMDDASNRDTLKVIESYLNDQRIHYYNSQINDNERYKTTRYAALINQAISLSTGEYISYLTDDTTYLPNRLEVMVQFLDSNPNVDIVYSKQKVKMVDNQLNTVSESIRHTKGVLKQPQNIVDHCSVMHRRSIAKKVYDKYGGYWDEHPVNWHNGDAAFWKRLVHFKSFYPIEEVLDISLKGPNSFQKMNAYLPEKIPNGTLVKGLLNKVYLIEGQIRREITEEMLKILKYHKQSIVTIPDPILYKHTEGVKIDESVFMDPEKFPNQKLVQIGEDDSIYYLQNKQRRVIMNKKALKRYYFSEKEIIQVPQSFFNNLPEGPPIYPNLVETAILPDRLVCKIGNKYYLSNDNTFHAIHLKVMKKLKLPTNKVIQINKREFTKFTIGKPFEWIYKS